VYLIYLAAAHERELMSELACLIKDKTRLALFDGKNK
jgi:hypothetical protein